MITHIPFMPKIRVNGEEISLELMEQIEKCGSSWGKDAHDFSAKFELLPDPRGKRYGHFLVSEVTYLKGRLAPKELKD